jgi:hypothetical protein
MRSRWKAVRAPTLACGLALTLGACGSAVSTSSFKGEQHAVAQTISNLQSDVTAGEQKKVCADDLAASLVNRLGGRSGCEAAVKSQLGEIDSTTLEIVSVQLAAGGRSASSQVKSVYSGKKRTSTLLLTREGSSWRVSGLQ